MNSLLIATLTLLAMIVSTSSNASSLPAPDDRVRLNFNREWKFEIGDHPGANAPNYDDSSWDDIGLPHSFGIPYFMSPQFYVGYGWYRKHFDIPSSWKDKRIFIEFDGAFQDAEVYLNGTEVGHHLGGYTGFSLDVTSAGKLGQNVVAVRLNNLWNPRLAPRAGEHTFNGGIYRDVWLVATDPVHVTWYGTFVTTPQASTQSGTVNVKTEVRNDSGSTRKCSLETKIIDPDGKTLAKMSSSISIQSGGTVNFDQTSVPIHNPKLWHPDHPYLYQAASTLLEDKRQVDSYNTTFGMRSIKWTAENGFFLNGEHYWLHGADVHQDHAGWGDAVTDSGAERDIKLVKGAGFNFIRGSHYPHSPAFATACDQQGVLLWSENDFWGIGGFGSDGYWNASAYPVNPADDSGFEQSVKDSLRDEIRIERNHPSIIAWSMCNEVFFVPDSVLPKVRRLLKGCVDLTHQLDPTRPAGIGGCQRGDIDKIGDVAGYNGDGATLFLDPGIPNLVTEYSSTSAWRPGDYIQSMGSLTGQPQFPWRSGEALWCMFDHGSIAGKGLAIMGIVDYFRIRKRGWYWYREQNLGIPPPSWPEEGTPAGLKLTADKTVLKSVDGTDDSQIMVAVVDAAGKELSNNVPVTLSIVSGPGEFPTGPAITFLPASDDPQSAIFIRDGKAAIEFRSYYAGASVIRATSPNLPPATITITSLGAPKYVRGVTPDAKQIPYVEYRPSITNSSQINATLALNRPTLASSTAVGSSAALANDGNTSTAWMAQTSDALWRVDLENSYAIKRVEVAFPSTGTYRYTVDVSQDGNSWTTVINKTASYVIEPTSTSDGNFGTGIRFIRVHILSAPEGQMAGLAEVKVSGVQG